MIDLLDEISELVYVADPFSYELKYVNSTGMKTLGMTECNGQKCYEAIQGADRPCDFCTNHMLHKDSFYTWRHYNPRLGRQYLLKDKLIDWEGKPCRLEIAFDVTESERQERMLETIMHAEKTVMECISMLHQTKNMHFALDQILGKIGRVLQAERAYIFEISEEQMSNTHEWCRDDITPQISELQNLPVEGEGQWVSSHHNGSGTMMGDVDLLKEKYPEECAALERQGISRLIVVPLELEGRLLGYLGLDNPPAALLEYATPLLSTLGYFISARIRREEDKRMLDTLGQYDSLTGALNRQAFIHELEAQEGKDCAVGIVCIDINGMKEINDVHGQPYGDKVLEQTAQYLVTLFGPGRLYRSGGDEFVILLPEIEYGELTALLRELRASLMQEVKYHVSVGFQWSSSCADMKKILSDAEQMMYVDKKHFYQDKQGTRYRHSGSDFLGLTKPGALEDLLEKGRFLIYFQPKFSVATQELMGAEALIRLKGSDGMIILPDQFIPQLEQARCISMIDFYVFEHVCRSMARWRKEGKPLYPVSVNFSRDSLTENQFQEHLLHVWKKYDIPVELLEIEVTESMEESDGYDFSHVIEGIRKIGFPVAIDDFGAKHANLSLFTAIDFDVLKVDKSLVWQMIDNPKAQAIIQSGFDICKKMGIGMIAEGVETQAHLKALETLGCTGVQGYLFSKPLPQELYEEQYLT